jgi:intein-encoded DNA endonuclease-like protein
LPADERIRIYQEALGLFAKGQNAHQTWKRVSSSNDIKLHRNTVYLWTKGDRDPSKKYLGRVISGPSPELSYVIMAAKGDGCSGKRPNGVKGHLYVTDFRVRDKDFAEEFASSASFALHRATPYKVKVSDQGFCSVAIRSKMLFEIIGGTSIAPLRRYVENSRDTMISGIRGFFDAEGGPSVGINHRGEFLAAISAANSNLDILQYLKGLLRRLEIYSRVSVNAYPAHWAVINGRAIFFAKSTHTLFISRIEDVKSFIRTVGSSIERKSQKLNDITKVLEEKARDRANTWLSIYQKDDKGEYRRKAQLSQG